MFRLRIKSNHSLFLYTAQVQQHVHISYFDDICCLNCCKDQIYMSMLISSNEYVYERCTHVSYVWSYVYMLFLMKVKVVWQVCQCRAVAIQAENAQSSAWTVYFVLMLTCCQTWKVKITKWYACTCLSCFCLLVAIFIPGRKSLSLTRSSFVLLQPLWIWCQ
jgi:hypothetical protein